MRQRYTFKICIYGKSHGKKENKSHTYIILYVKPYVYDNEEYYMYICIVEIYIYIYMGRTFKVTNNFGKGSW